MKSKVLEQVEEFKSTISQKQPVLELTPLNFSEIQFDVEREKIILGDYKFDDKALNKINSLLSIKKDLPKKLKKVSNESWDVLKDVLKDIGNRQGYFAEVDTNTKIIKSIKSHNNRKNTEEQLIENLNFTDHIIDNLSKSDVNLEIGNLIYDIDNNIIKMDFINSDSEFEVLKNWKGVSSDTWKTGFSIEKDSFQTKFNSFLYRLVCTNGMTTKEIGNTSALSNNASNYDSKIHNQLEKLFIGYDSDLIRDIQEKCKLLSKYNLSVDEYSSIFKKLTSLNSDENYQELINKKFIHFDRIKGFYEFKGIDIDKQSPVWLKSANSGLSAYDVFNQLTEISSHPDTYQNLNQKDANQIQIWSQNLFFNNLDLSQIAQKYEPVFN